MKQTTTLILLLGALPLLVYPFVLLAGAMSLGGHRTGNEPFVVILAVYAVLVASLAYPLVYGACVVGTVMKTRRDQSTAALYFSLSPMDT